MRRFAQIDHPAHPRFGSCLRRQADGDAPENSIAQDALQRGGCFAGRFAETDDMDMLEKPQVEYAVRDMQEFAV